MIRLLKLGVSLIAALALLVFAPGAFASTMTEADGAATWTAAPGIANSTTFTDSATDITISTADDPVIYNDAGGTSNNVTTDCTDSDGTAMDGTADQVTCATPPVTTVTANSLDLNDFEDASALTDHPITINGGDDNDTVYGGDLNDTLSGEAGDDSVQGGPGSDTISGGDGNDSLQGMFCCGGGADGNDTITGGNGNDSAEGQAGDDNIDLGAGDDSAGGGPGNDTINGGDGNDSELKGGPGNDVINGGAGDDEIYGDCDGSCGVGAPPGDDTINAGDGNDYAEGEAGNDTIDMGAGNDTAFGDCSFGGNCSSGTPGNDVIQGGDGIDELHGQKGNDTVDGGAGDDSDVVGGPGDDTVLGGPGNDEYVAGDAGADNVDGGPGDDFISEFDDGNAVTDFQPDVIHGGDGYDEVSWYTGCNNSSDTGTLSLDDQANDSFTAHAGGCTTRNDPNNNFGSDIERINVNAGLTAETVTGTAAANAIYTNSGADTVDPGAGSDTVATFAGDDTVTAVDGFPDFIDCGTGTDTANVDQFDTTVRCETVNVTNVASAFATAEDLPPTVAWVTPAPGVHGIPSGTPTNLQVAASDDHGVAKVEFYVGSRLVCTATAAPFTCSYLPTSADTGRDTLTAIAYDTAGQTASALNTVTVPRFNAKSLSSKTRPAKDTTFPFHFTTTGKLSLPANVKAADGCKGGFITVQFRAAKKTISSRRVGLKKDCTYTSAVTFKIPARLHPKTLQVLVRFLGNGTMTPKKAKTHKVGV